MVGIGTPNVVLSLIGLSILGAGLLGAAGVGPIALAGLGPAQLSVGIVAQFSWKTANLTAIVTPNNVLPAGGSNSVPGCPSFSSTIYWGDGAVVPANAAASYTHTYIQNGIYTVSETVLETLCTIPKSTSQVSVSAQLTAPSATSGTASSGLGKTPSSVAPSFSVQTSNLNVTLRDTSVATNESIKAVTFAFGDGAMSTPGAGGLVTSHVYTAAGTYRVLETVTGSAQVYCSNCGAGTYPIFTTATNVTVVVGVSSAATVVGPSPPPAASGALSGPVLAAIFGGGALAGLPLVLRSRFGTALGLSGAAGVIGFAFGVGWI
jgi:hypothetical protein